MTKVLVLTILIFANYAECFDSVNVRFLYKSNAVLDCASANFASEDIEFYRVTKNDNQELIEEKIIPYQDKNQNEKVLFDGTKMTLVDLRRPEITADYFCKSSTQAGKLHFVKEIQPYLMVPEKISQTITTGGYAEFICEVLYGNENNEKIEWSWIRNGTELEESDPSFNITRDQKKTVLLINPVEDVHKGHISCVVKNQYGSHSSEFQLRVKNTLAALWPFLGICAEVVILCIIIIVYEKKCNKKSHNNEDNEQSENLMSKEVHSDLKKRNPKV